MFAATAEAALWDVHVSMLCLLGCDGDVSDLHREVRIDQVVEAGHEDAQHSGAG
jgi:hypothetical protein